MTTIRPLKLLSPSLSSFKLRLVNSRLLRTNLKLLNRSLRKLLPRKLLSMLNTLKSKKLRTECKLRPTNSRERWTKQPSLLTLSLITRSDGLRTLLNLLKLRFSFVEMSLKLVPLSLTVDLSMLSLELSCSSRVSATISTSKRFLTLKTYNSKTSWLMSKLLVIGTWKDSLLMNSLFKTVLW